MNNIFSGMVCLVTGAILSLCSIMGDFRLLRTNFIYIYLISSMLNTLDAIRILSGPKFTKARFQMFSLTAILNNILEIFQ